MKNRGKEDIFAFICQAPLVTLGEGVFSSSFRHTARLDRDICCYLLSHHLQQSCQRQYSWKLASLRCITRYRGDGEFMAFDLNPKMREAAGTSLACFSGRIWVTGSSWRGWRTFGFKEELIGGKISLVCYVTLLEGEGGIIDIDKYTDTFLPWASCWIMDGGLEREEGEHLWSRRSEVNILQ